ncbi:MAG: glycoside hydrolase family 172 protein [Pontiella sp.]
MKNKEKRLCVRVMYGALLVANAWSADRVTIESLLTEMMDHESVARFPVTEFRLKQESSYNRASKTPDDPDGWFTNHDYNSNDRDHNFIRIEENNGQKEWVLMDHEGPGALVRTWMPFMKPNKPDTDLQIRIYLDGATEPVLEGNMLGLLDGTGLIPYPLAHQSLRSAVSFFPIPYAKSCKITTTGRPFFYQLTFREYSEGTSVKTFTMEDFKKAEPLTATVGEVLLNPTFAENESSRSTKGKLLPGQEQKLALPSGASAAVRELMVKLGNYDDPTITRSVVLKMEFDGKETVWCPIGDFFGCGIGLNPFKGWYRTVAEDGTLMSRWVMPYQDTGSISLLNLGDEPVDFTLEATTEPWNWDERSMYFNAAWRGQYPVSTRPFSDWNYVTLQGRGVYVGDTLTVMNPVEKWWGEGDEKIWVDGEDFPSIFGTGTEDYYAYSWGGRSTDFYEHPFHAQPFCHTYNKLNRKTDATERNTKGYSTETRTRSLDTMPFGSSLKLDMEIWSWTDCDMGYGVGMYWYGDAATTSNRKSDAKEALAVPPLPESEEVNSFKGAVEFEEMDIVSRPESLVLVPQNLKKYKGIWNEDDHVLFKGLGVGAVVEFRIPASSPVAEKLVLYATQSRDFGILRFSVNGRLVGEDVDFYAAKPIAIPPIVLGVFEPVDGGYTLRVEVVGKNQKSRGMFFGLDCITRTHVK